MLRNYYHYIHMSICMKNIFEYFLSKKIWNIQGEMMNDIERAWSRIFFYLKPLSYAYDQVLAKKCETRAHDCF